MLTRNLLSLLVFTALGASACSEASFYGGTPSKALKEDTRSPEGDNPGEEPGATPNDPTGPDAPSATPETPIVPPCADTERSIGAQIAFLIDNSSSNKSTDCTDPKIFGRANGVDIVECQGATNREKAMLAAYDLLAEIAAKEADNAEAVSSLQIASFPTKADYINGHARETNAWLDVSAGGRGAAESAMLFSRKPYGTTPFGAALTGADEIFSESVADRRAKVAILVTDGEPTDRKPSEALAKAQALRAAGVQVITVFVTGKDLRETRRQKHLLELQQLEHNWTQAGVGHWYDDASYASFNQYANAVLGDQNTPSLVAQVSAKTIEVQDSSALREALLGIIKTEAIRCEQ